MAPQFQLRFKSEARRNLEDLRTTPALAKRFKAVRKALGLLEIDPRYPGLNTHPYHSLAGDNGETVFESYAENKTPAAFRIFWHYGSKGSQTIIILSITPHP